MLDLTARGFHAVMVRVSDMDLPSFPFNVGVALYLITPKDVRRGVVMGVCLSLSPSDAAGSSEFAPGKISSSSKWT